MRRGAIAALVSALMLGVPAGGRRGAACRSGHVFVIVLENKDYDQSFGPQAKSPQLGQVAAVAGRAADAVLRRRPQQPAQLHRDGLRPGPNPVTQSDCQIYQDFAPGHDRRRRAGDGRGLRVPGRRQDRGRPARRAAGLTWGGYMEDMGNTTTGDKTCRHPALEHARLDPARDGRPTSTRRATTRSSTSTRSSTARTARRATSRSTASRRTCSRSTTTPNLTFITPDLCSDGHDEPCADGRPGGYASIDTFLKEWVPRIEASPAYQQDGALIVTFDESESGAEGCCVQDHRTRRTPAARRRPGRRAHRHRRRLAVRDARDDDRQAVQPLLVPAHDRGPLRPVAPRLRRALDRVRLRRLQRAARRRRRGACRSTTARPPRHAGAGTLIAGVRAPAAPSGCAWPTRPACSSRPTAAASPRATPAPARPSSFRAPAGTRQALVKATVRGAARAPNAALLAGARAPALPIIRSLGAHRWR